MADPNELAARLAKARASRTAVASFAEEFPDLDLATAYQAQAVQRDAAGPLVGWKLGVTSRAKQAQVGVDAPIRGFLASEHVLDAGEPLHAGDFIAPRAEPEIAFVMGTDLAGDHVSAAQVLAATQWVAPGIEILDSRYTDYTFTMPDVVADNASAAKFVLGTPVPAAGLDLRLVGVLLEKNGDVVATASGAASLGNPAAAVAWLVRSLATEGLGLRAGDVIISGGLTAAHPVAAGDVVVVSIDRLGSVDLAGAMTEVVLGEPAERERWEVEHEGRLFVVLRHDGRWLVVDGLCPHRQGRLVEGLVRGDTLVCPSHWYGFDLTTGACRTSPDFRLGTYPVIERDGELLADIPQQVERTWSEVLRAHARSTSTTDPSGG